MISTMYVHVFKEDVIGQGYTLAVIHVGGDLSIFFREDNPLPQMECLRDELDRQIDAIKAERAKPVSAPADPEPLSTVEALSVLEAIGAASYMPPAEVLPQGQPVVELRCEHCDQINGLGGCILKANHEGPHFWEDAPF